MTAKQFGKETSRNHIPATCAFLWHALRRVVFFLLPWFAVGLFLSATYHKFAVARAADQEAVPHASVLTLDELRQEFEELRARMKKREAIESEPEAVGDRPRSTDEITGALGLLSAVLALVTGILSLALLRRGKRNATLGTLCPCYRSWHQATAVLPPAVAQPADDDPPRPSPYGHDWLKPTPVSARSDRP